MDVPIFKGSNTSWQNSFEYMKHYTNCDSVDDNILLGAISYTSPHLRQLWSMTFNYFMCVLPTVIFHVFFHRSLCLILIRASFAPPPNISLDKLRLRFNSTPWSDRDKGTLHWLILIWTNSLFLDFMVLVLMQNFCVKNFMCQRLH